MFASNHLRFLVCCIALAALSNVGAKAQTTLDFNDVAPGTLVVFSPYTSQGFQLTSSAGGFIFNSPDTGNGSPQTIGNNPFYAGANGLASFSPATITLAAMSGDPFDILSIDLARNFAFDPGPSVTFTGHINGGGTVVQTFDVTTSSPPLVFQNFSFTGFTNLSSVTWEQGAANQGIHQFSNIVIESGVTAVPEPGSYVLFGSLALSGISVVLRRRRG